MDVEVGSNLYRNTDGMIEIEGVPQIQVALKPTTGDLLVTFALFDAGGKVTAKLVDSTLMINERRAYEDHPILRSVRASFTGWRCENMSIGSGVPAVAIRSAHFGRIPVARNFPITCPA